MRVFNKTIPNRFILLGIVFISCQFIILVLIANSCRILLSTLPATQSPQSQTEFNGSIGIFDSGVGGLSIYQGVKNLLINERVVYVGDMAHSPYGEKSAEFILQRCHKICQYLQRQGVKAIVVACNTATVSVIDSLRAQFSLPIIGVEPAVKPAALHSKTGHVGVFATRATLASRSFNQLMADLTQFACFHTVACRGLVEAIETMPHDDNHIQRLLNDFSAQVLSHNIDALVLGCTHYPFIKHQLRHILPKHIDIYDTAQAVARQLQRRLQQVDGLAPQTHSLEDVFLTSGDAAFGEQIFSRLLNKSTKVKQLII